MANAKSNIYPIQLQGAELCLNRYDAEIKQYSGFNKNNSPFVGGCLSNVFTKEEQIEGGNADNTYIDTNGNVYRVDNTGVFRNDTKIIEYPSSVKFYKKREVNINDSNIVKVFNDSIFITKKDNIHFEANETEYKTSDYYAPGYIAHWGDGFSCVLGDVYTIAPSFLDIVSNGKVIIFSYKKVVSDPSDNRNNRIITYFLIIPDLESSSYEFITPANSSNFGLSGYSKRYEVTFNSQTAWIKSDTVFYLAPNDETYSTSNSGKYVCEIILQNGSIRYKNYLSRIATDNITQIDTTHFNFLPSVYLSDWYMTNEGLFYFKRTSTKETTFDLSSYTDKTLYFNVVIKIGLSSGVPPLPTSFESIIKINVIPSSSNVDHNFTIKQMKGVFTPYYCFFSGIFYKDRYSSQTRSFKQFGLFSFSGTYQNMAMSIEVTSDGYKMNDITTGGTVFYDNFKILINNGVVTGISIADFYFDNYIACHRDNESLNGVLVEEWNTIQDFSIFNNKLFYCKNGKYFCIEEDTPKIKKMLNQLVVNCNYQKNAFYLENEEVTHFAPDWNNSILNKTQVYTGREFNQDGTPNTGDDYFIASAINEYDLKNNPSLLMNMVSSCFDLTGFVGYITTRPSASGVSTVFYKNSYFIENYLENCAPNCYAGLKSENKATYKGTPIPGFVNEKLVGLPFPNDANGNIQYSPSLFSKIIQSFGEDAFLIEGEDTYQLAKSDNLLTLSYYLGSLVEGLKNVFIIQGQYYGIINNSIFSIQFQNGIVANLINIVSVENMQFVGYTPYEALFFSKTNRCLYSFTGANVLNQKQLVDKISEVRNYLYNPATQTVFLITDIGVLFYGLFGMFLLDYTNITSIFLLDNGIVMSDNNGNYRYIKYYLDEGDTDYEKQNIRLETSFYGMNNEMVTINDCLYFRLFSEEHEEGSLKVSATTISLSGRKTEETTFKIKASDWDKITHTIYLRYQPKTQRGLGVAFAIDSPFKIASMSVGSQPDAVLVDKVSKGAITAPSVTTNNNEW